MYIENWVLWLIAIVIIFLIIRHIIVCAKIEKSKRMFDDLVRANNNVISRIIIGLFDESKEEEQMDVLTSAFLNGVDSSVLVNKNILDTQDILSSYQIFDGINPRENIKQVTINDVEGDTELLEANIRASLEKYIKKHAR